jgi:hypothetical protein
MSIRRIRRAVREDHYEFTIHALEEMDEDGITETDIREALLRGRVAAKLTDDPRGIRFVVRGTPKGIDMEIKVVCRFLPSGLLRRITVYSLEEQSQ